MDPGLGREVEGVRLRCLNCLDQVRGHLHESHIRRRSPKQLPQPTYDVLRKDASAVAMRILNKLHGVENLTVKNLVVTDQLLGLTCGRKPAVVPPSTDRS